MRSTVRIVAGGLALATAAVLIPAGPAAAAPEYPAPTGRCVDETGVLGPDLCVRVTEILLRDERESSDEIAVAVVPSTGEATIEAWSTGLFNSWGVGKKSQNNGVLLVVAVDDRRVRLATGRGLAKRLDDKAAGTIIDSTVTPRFAEEKYAVGILTGLDEVRRRLGHRTAGIELAALAEPAAEPVGGETVGGETVGGPDFTGDLPGFTDDGPDFAGDVPEEEGPGVPLGPFLIAGLVLLGIIGFATRMAGSGALTARHDATGHDDDRHATRWQSSSSPPPSSGHSGSSSSSSDFGGGGSSGGGASGSW